MNGMPDDWTLPAVTERNRVWFESGTLAIQACAACGTRQHPPEEICHRCGSMSFTSDELAPHGVLHSYTVVHYPVNRALAEVVPYVVALVALDDDPTIRVVANLLDVEPTDVTIGMRLDAIWQDRSDGEGTIRLLQWVPAAG
ncbi:MAG: Zn-ribbon domain-containing OB-fold protein [Acidimicrobiales bacterium]